MTIKWVSVIFWPDIICLHANTLDACTNPAVSWMLTYCQQKSVLH
jgi:hypothetical protein